MSEDLVSMEDALKRVTKKKKFDLLIKLSLGYFKISPDKAMSFAEEALAIAESEEDKSLTPWAKPTWGN